MNSDDASRYSVRDKATRAVRGPAATTPRTFEPFMIRSLARQRLFKHEKDDDDDDDDDVINNSDEYCGCSCDAVCLKSEAMPAVVVTVAPTTTATPTTINDQRRQNKLLRVDYKEAADSGGEACREGTLAVSADDDDRKTDPTGKSQKRPVSACTAFGRRPLLLTNSSSRNSSKRSHISSSSSI